MEAWFIFSFLFIFTASIIMIGPIGKKHQAVRFFGWFWLSVALLMVLVVYIVMFTVDWNTPPV